MPGKGQVPKENALRRNETDLSHLEAEGETPDKLKKLRNRSNYCADTQLWWDTWMESPQAEVFQSTDYLRLQMIAPLVESYFRGRSKGSHYAMAEIRQNESLLGGTVADRMRLRMGKKDEGKNPGDLPEDVADFVAAFDRKNA